MLNVSYAEKVAIDAVRAAYGIRKEDLMGRSRAHPIGEARAVAFFLCRSLGMSFPRIGRLFGRDHTTVLIVLKHFTASLANKPELARDVAELVKMVELEPRAEAAE